MTLHFTWWETLLVVLVFAAIPLGIACAICGVWYYFSRTRTALVATIVFGVPFAIGATTFAYGSASNWSDNRQAEAEAAAHTRTLTKSEMIKGARLPAGTVVYDDGFNPTVNVTLKNATTIYGVPVRDNVNYGDDGVDGEITFARDTTIDGVPCKAGAGKFERGTLDTCTLARPATIRGVPCRGYVILIAGDASSLACTIARPFRKNGVLLPAGDDILFGSYTVGSRSPSVRLFGKPLETQTRLTFEKANVSFYLSHERVADGCHYELISREAGMWTGIGYDIGRQRQCRTKLAAGSVTL